MEKFSLPRNLTNLDITLVFAHFFEANGVTREAGQCLSTGSIFPFKAPFPPPLTPFQTLIPSLIDRRRTGQQMAKLLKRFNLRCYMALPGADIEVA